MKKTEMEQIFAGLEEIADDLKKAGGDENKKKECFDRLLELRTLMDRYVASWLAFEEKVNELQDKFGFTLPDETAALFLNTLEEVPHAIEKKNRFADSLTLRGENETCIQSFRKGLGFLELSMLNEAVAEFEQAVSANPGLLLARLCLGIAYMESGRTDNALREMRFVQALTDDSRINAVIHNALGNVYASNGKYEQALHEFNCAVSLDTEFDEALFNLAVAYYNIGEHQKSLTTFAKIKDVFYRNWEVYYYIAKNYQKEGDTAEALSYMLKAQHLTPDDPVVILETGFLYEEFGELAKAMECYCRAGRLCKKKSHEKRKG